MKIINIVLVLVVALLILLHPGTVEAATYNCDCQGNYYDYYKLGQRPYYFQMFDHEYNSDGVVIRDLCYQYGRVVLDKEYYIRVTQTNSAGYRSLWLARIFISSDNKITLYSDDEGNTTEYDYDKFSDSGICNNLYWTADYSYRIFYSNTNTHEMIYSSGHQYEMELDATESISEKIEELAIYLCGGEDASLPGGVTAITPLPVYDLEPPLGVVMNASDATNDINITDNSDASLVITPYKIWWNQSNIDLTGYETEFYVREYGKHKKSLFASWEALETSWVFDASYVTAKYCNNKLKWHEFNCREEGRLYYLSKELLGDEPFQVKFLNCDFMIRNKKQDENGQMHYSNWVYVNTYDDGTYSVFEMEQDYTLDEDSDETGNINTDSEIYDDETVYTDTDYSPDVGGITDAAQFIRVLKDLANSLGDFPDLFAQIFSFLPGWVLVCIGTLFVVIMLKGIF